MGLSLHCEDFYFDDQAITITADLLFEPRFKQSPATCVISADTGFRVILESEVTEDNTVSFTLSAGELSTGDYRVRICCESAEISDLFMVVPRPAMVSEKETKL